MKKKNKFKADVEISVDKEYIIIKINKHKISKV